MALPLAIQKRYESSCLKKILKIQHQFPTQLPTVNLENRTPHHPSSLQLKKGSFTIIFMVNFQIFSPDCNFSGKDSTKDFLHVGLRFFAVSLYYHGWFWEILHWIVLKDVCINKVANLIYDPRIFDEIQVLSNRWILSENLKIVCDAVLVKLLAVGLQLP